MRTQARRAMIGAALGLVGVMMAGCQDGGSRRQAWLRGSDPASVDARTAARVGILPDEPDADGSSIQPESTRVAEDLTRESRGFFRPTRRAGTLSSEAAEIEASLGVPR